jgi:hypothetical protein
MGQYGLRFYIAEVEGDGSRDVQYTWASGHVGGLKETEGKVRHTHSGQHAM